MTTIEDEDLDVDLGEDESGEELPLEEKYANQMRQIFPQKIELPISTLGAMIPSQIDLNPDFQRRDVWDQKKQSKFIESLIMNVPIPPVFMGEDKYSKYVVLDGRQRLTAIVKYLKNEYELVGLKVWNELNGKRFSELEEMELDVTITRRFLPAVVLLKESSSEVKYDVFERLNTGGLNLKPMEIRNAVYRGKFTDLLHECAGNPNFRHLWGIPDNEKERKKNKTYMRMADLELVLRFFALSSAQKRPSEKRPALKMYLGNYMKRQNERLEKKDDESARKKDNFDRAVSNCLTLLGENAFRRGEGNKRSAPLADALLYALADINLKPANLEEAKAKASEVLTKLEKENEDFQDAMASGTNGRAKIETRLREAKAAFDEALACLS